MPGIVNRVEGQRVKNQIAGTLDDLHFAQKNLRRMEQRFPSELLLKQDIREAIFAVRLHLDGAKRWGVILQAFVDVTLKRQAKGAQDGVASQG